MVRTPGAQEAGEKKGAAAVDLNSIPSDVRSAWQRPSACEDEQEEGASWLSGGSSRRIDRKTPFTLFR